MVAFALDPLPRVEGLEAHRKAQDDERSKLGNVWKDNGLVFPSTVGTP